MSIISDHVEANEPASGASKSNDGSTPPNDIEVLKRFRAYSIIREIGNNEAS